MIILVAVIIAIVVAAAIALGIVFGGEYANIYICKLKKMFVRVILYRTANSVKP